MALELVSLTPTQALGIPVALVGSVFLALGAQFQHRGVSKNEQEEPPGTKTGLNPKALLALIRRPEWVAGTLMLGLAIVLQLFSLYLAPLTVVQPLGAVALVITAVLNARATGTKLGAPTIRAVALCVGGIGLFVSVAALTTTTVPIHDLQLIIVLIILGAVLTILALSFGFFRRKFTTLSYISAAGVLFGFVATLAKVVIDRVHTLIQFGFHYEPGDGLTFVCVAGLVAAALSGSYFVQSAYSSGPPDLVVAGLTVIDPLIGVSIGISVLGEASSAPIWATPVFLLAGALAVYGVFQLSTRHTSPV
ncbi:DMT family transporter [Pseudarthrobacter sp. J1763]|uniref:DMT family transporter n=1 Tax=Pseudarthrobacter sp. J1763 TaxID=3420445 RepID=UPI003D299C19